jgi:hypothetical protein
MASIYVGGVDVETLGFYPADAPDYLSRSDIEVVSVVVPGRPGRLSTNVRNIDAKTFAIRGAVRGADITTNRASLRTIHNLFGGGDLVMVKLTDVTDVQIQARCRSVRVVPPDGALIVPRLMVEATFVADYPFWQAVTPTSVNLTGSYAALPMGSAPCYVTWTINTCTNPTLTIKDSTGAVVLTVTLTTTIAAGDIRKIIGSENRITKRISGVTTQDDTLLTSGTFPRELKREWAVYSTSSWATAALSATAGTPTGTADYSPCYW